MCTTLNAPVPTDTGVHFFDLSICYQPGRKIPILAQEQKYPITLNVQ